MTITASFLDSVSTKEIRKHVEALQGVRHPLVAPEALLAAEAYIRNFFLKSGYDVTDHCFEDNGLTFRNIIATHWGTELRDERVMLIAHFDTVGTSPGADDNASGVAALLELARVFSSARPRRSLQFVATNLEEYPVQDYVGQALRGSRPLAEFAKENRWDIREAIVLESIGYAGDVKQESPPVPIEIPEKGDFVAVVGNSASADLVTTFCRAVATFQLPLPFIPLVVPGNGEALPDTRRSDHAPFWDHGYKAIMLTDTANLRNPNYHKATDTADTLNFGFTAEVCRAVAAVTIELCGCE